MNDDIVGLIICGFVMVLLLIISTILRTGRGINLLSVYHLIPKNKKEEFNTEEMCRYFGNVLLIVLLLLIPAIISGILDIVWLALLVCAIIFILAFAATIYAYTDKRFRK